MGIAIPTKVVGMLVVSAFLQRFWECRLFSRETKYKNKSSLRFILFIDLFTWWSPCQPNSNRTIKFNKSSATRSNNDRGMIRGDHTPVIGDGKAEEWWILNLLRVLSPLVRITYDETSYISMKFLKQPMYVGKIYNYSYGKHEIYFQALLTLPLPPLLKSFWNLGKCGISPPPPHFKEMVKNKLGLSCAKLSSA